MELWALTVGFHEHSLIINEATRQLQLFTSFLAFIYKNMYYIFETKVHKYKIIMIWSTTLFYHPILSAWCGIYLGILCYVMYIYCLENCYSSIIWKKSISISIPITFYQLYVSLLGKCRFRCPPQFYWSEIHGKNIMHQVLEILGGMYIYTTSWGPANHKMSPPGCRPPFLKPKFHKESKNGFKPINYRPPLLVIFSKNYFRLQKS